MYYINLNIYDLIIWIIFALLVLLPWITIPAIFIYEFFHVMKMPKTNISNTGSKEDELISKLGLTRGK